MSNAVRQMIDDPTGQLRLKREDQDGRDAGVATFAESCAEARIAIIQSNLKSGYYNLPAIFLVTAIIFGRQSGWTVALAWAALSAAGTFGCMRLVTGIPSTPAPSVRDARNRLARVGLILAVSSLSWAAIPFLFWIPGSLENNMLCMILLCGGISYIVGVSSASLLCYSLHCLPLVAVLIVWPVFNQGNDGLLYSTLTTLFSIMMFSVAVRLNNSLTKGLEIKEHNSLLLVQLARAKTESDAARQRAERANQAKSTFLANMSHELRTPLNAILGFSEVLKGEMLGPIGTPLYRDYANDIHGSGKHLLGLINDILDLSRIEAGRFDLTPTELDVGEIIEDSCRLVALRAEQGGIKIVQNLSKELPLLQADERALRQILLNLITNAVKFTPRGGTVTVGARLEADENGLTSMSVYVEDTGVGIKAEEIPLVLEAFGQARIEDFALTAAPEQGTGLGLPIVRGLIDAHGGSFSLQSELGYGTKATATFPPPCLSRRRRGSTGDVRATG